MKVKARRRRKGGVGAESTEGSISTSYTEAVETPVIVKPGPREKDEGQTPSKKRAKGVFKGETKWGLGFELRGSGQKVRGKRERDTKRRKFLAWRRGS